MTCIFVIIDYVSVKEVIDKRFVILECHIILLPGVLALS